MGRPKKTETISETISENKKENKKEKENRYFQVVKTLKNGNVMMIKGYDKEIK